MIIICPEYWQDICTHAEQTYPEECCGLLLGQIHQNSKIVVEVWSTPNSWDGNMAHSFSQITGLAPRETNKQRSFTIAPRDMLKAQKYAAEHQLAIVGIYHSHPDYLAIPSEFDRAIAWQQYSYIIISVREGKATDGRSWVLNDEGQFEEETITQ